MWKPTKAGVYTMDGAVVIVHDNYVLPLNGQMTDLCDGMKWVKESTGIWAMLSPDWQDGAPSTEQLDKWKWWYSQTSLDHKMGPMIGEFHIYLIDDSFYWECGSRSSETIIKSAPIQPYLSNGPLWVPLEVAK